MFIHIFAFFTACDGGGIFDTQDTNSSDCNDPGGCENEPLMTTIRSVAPYGWSGDHRIAPLEDWDADPKCEAQSICEYSFPFDNSNPLDEYAILLGSVRGSGPGFICVDQFLDIQDWGETYEIADQWLGEGICGLAPSGEYSGKDVKTSTSDLLNGKEQVMIAFNSNEAIVTGTTFFYQNDEYLLEGWIADDLSEIYYHLIYYDEDGNIRDEYENTIYQE
jgi:hypothetical protein